MNISIWGARINSDGGVSGFLSFFFQFLIIFKSSHKIKFSSVWQNIEGCLISVHQYIFEGGGLFFFIHCTESSDELSSHFILGVFLFCFSNVCSTFLFALKNCHMDCFDCFHNMQMIRALKNVLSPKTKYIYLHI